MIKAAYTLVNDPWAYQILSREKADGAMEVSIDLDHAFDGHEMESLSTLFSTLKAGQGPFVTTICLRHIRNAAAVMAVAGLFCQFKGQIPVSHLVFVDGSDVLDEELFGYTLELCTTVNTLAKHIEFYGVSLRKCRDLTALAEAFKKNEVESLMMRSTAMYDNQLGATLHAIRSGSRVRKIHLEPVITSHECDVLLESLVSCEVLEQLRFHVKKFEPSNMEHLRTLFRDAGTEIRKLELECEEMDLAAELADILPLTSLHELYIWSCPVKSRKDMLHILQGIAACATLETFMFDLHSLETKESLRDIMSVLSSHPSLNNISWGFPKAHVKVTPGKVTFASDIPDSHEQRLLFTEFAAFQQTIKSGSVLENLTHLLGRAKKDPGNYPNVKVMCKVAHFLSLPYQAEEEEE